VTLCVTLCHTRDVRSEKKLKTVPIAPTDEKELFLKVPDSSHSSQSKSPCTDLEVAAMSSTRLDLTRFKSTWGGRVGSRSNTSWYILLLEAFSAAGHRHREYYISVLTNSSIVHTSVPHMESACLAFDSILPNLWQLWNFMQHLFFSPTFSECGPLRLATQLKLGENKSRQVIIIRLASRLTACASADEHSVIGVAVSIKGRVETKSSTQHCLNETSVFIASLP
jgi:hypothetical protein